MKAAKKKMTGSKTPKAKASTDGEAPKNLSALDAAAQVLAKAKKPMNAKELVEEMAAKGLWKSPGGKTPAATLSAAIGTEISHKGADARFRKVSPGHWKHAGK